MIKVFEKISYKQFELSMENLECLCNYKLHLQTIRQKRLMACGLYQSGSRRTTSSSSWKTLWDIGQKYNMKSQSSWSTTSVYVMMYWAHLSILRMENQLSLSKDMSSVCMCYRHFLFSVYVRGIFRKSPMVFKLSMPPIYGYSERY